MKTTGNTVLITGGATGIGFSLAQAFSEAGNQVIICGRREDKLQEAKAKLPQIETRTCDVANPDDRQALFEWITSNFPGLNILVNNAGIQRQVDFKQGTLDLFNRENEIAANLEAPIHLSALLITHFLNQPEAAIVNITSGLAFTPLAIVPIYCATKAALHSFSLSLRHQLSDTSIKVFEVAPPIVDTELDKGAREERGQEDRGIKPEEVAQSTLACLVNNQFEIVIGLANKLRLDSEKMFKIING
jgi:uncharacterized oxidoreductase